MKELKKLSMWLLRYFYSLGGVVEATLGVQIAEMPLGFQIRVGNQLHGGHPWLE